MDENEGEDDKFEGMIDDTDSSSGDHNEDDGYFDMEDDESDDSEDLPQQINVENAMKQQQYLSASDGYVMMEKHIEKRNALRMPFKVRLQQIESQKRLKNKEKKLDIHDIIKEKKREDKQQKTQRIIKILTELKKEGKIEDVAALNNVSAECIVHKEESLEMRDDFNEEELNVLTLIAQESVKHLPGKKNNRDSSSKPTLSNSKSVGFPFPPNSPQYIQSNSAESYAAQPYASPFKYNHYGPPSHYYHNQLDNINEAAQSNPNDKMENKISEDKVEGLADSGPNCAVDHMQDRIRLRQLLRKQKSMAHSISETKSSATVNRRQLMIKSMREKMKIDHEDKMLDDQLFHETAKLLKSDSDKRKHIKSKPKRIRANKPYISQESGAIPPLPPTPNNNTDKMPNTRPMLRYYHSDGAPDANSYYAYYPYYASHSHHAMYQYYPYTNDYPYPENTENTSNKSNDEGKTDPLLTYLGAFEPLIPPKDKVKEDKMSDNHRKKPSLPLHQKSSPPDFLYPEPPKQGDNKARSGSHAFSSAFASNNDHYGPQYPPRPTINPYANSNPVNHRKLHVLPPPHRPDGPQLSDAPQRHRPLMDSSSYNVFCSGDDTKKEKGKKIENEKDKLEKEKGKNRKKEESECSQRTNSVANSIHSKDSKASKESGFDAIDGEWLCSDYDEKNNSTYLSSTENKTHDKDKTRISTEIETTDHTPQQMKLDLNRSSVVKDDGYQLMPDKEPKLMDRASKVISIENKVEEMSDDENKRPKMSRSRHSARVPASQFETPIHNKNMNRKKRKHRNKHNRNNNVHQQTNYNATYCQPPSQQQYINYNQYPQTPTNIGIPYLSSVPMVNAATSSSAPPLNRATTAPQQHTQLKQLENTVEQLKSHFVQLLQHLPLTNAQQQQFNSVHQISSILANSNQNNAYPVFTNSINSSYSTPNIGLLNTNIIKQQQPASNQYPVNPQNIQNMHNLHNMQNMMFNMNPRPVSSQPNMPNYTFSNISNPALSSIPLTLTTNTYPVTPTTTSNTTNNAYLIPTIPSTPLYPQTPTNTPFNNMHHQ